MLKEKEIETQVSLNEKGKLEINSNCPTFLKCQKKIQKQTKWWIFYDLILKVVAKNSFRFKVSNFSFFPIFTPTEYVKSSCNDVLYHKFLEEEKIENFLTHCENNLKNSLNSNFNFTDVSPSTNLCVNCWMDHLIEYYQPLYLCSTCTLKFSKNVYVCLSCSKSCHFSHEISQSKIIFVNEIFQNFFF